MRIVRIGRSSRARYEAGIRALEESANYPLGEDRFNIDHGSEYFAFFDRLGDALFYAVLDGERVGAAASAILRKIPLQSGGPLRRTWYLCDLKVHPDYRGRHIPLRLLTRAFPMNYLRCPRGYAISMNTPGESHNRVKRLLERFRWAKLSGAGILEIYALDFEGFSSIRALVEHHRGPLSFLSLGGIKDIVLESTGSPMPLIHVQFGPCAERDRPEPVEGATHMFCCSCGDSLGQELKSKGIEPSASATLIQHRMQAADWRFVLTSDI